MWRRRTCALVIRSWGLPNGFHGICDGRVISGSVSDGCVQAISTITLPSNSPAIERGGSIATGLNHGPSVIRSDQIKFSRSLDTGRSVKSGTPVPRCPRLPGSGPLLGAGPGAWNSGPTVLDSLNDRVGLARGSWRETQRLDTTRHSIPEGKSLVGAARATTLSYVI